MIYLDYQATTPLAPEARAAMLPFLDERFGNPHSPHRMGREAAAAVEVARGQVASLLPEGGRLAFTSGATEALNWAIKGSRGPIVTVATEHAAVLDSARAAGQAGREIRIVPVDGDGLVDLAQARQAITPGTGLVAVMLVNNEIGVIQPVEPLAAMAHEAGALFLCDAVQGYGRVATPPGCDLMAISAHKIHGPKGVGALWIRDGVSLEPLLHGGGQETPGRSGTLAPMLCAGFGAAAALMAQQGAADAAHVERLWLIATRRLGPEWRINGSVEHRWRGNLNVRREGLDSARLISDLRELAFSAGSACASGSGRPSHVLKAIGLVDAQARSSIRLGFGRYTTEEDIDRAATMILDAAARQRMWAA
ncbi:MULTISPECIES: cysteine desulfurase family protein [unclassified Sphingomonas]|uniref:cysteine desulfurase family protein n=1 Tax=unclassified Sphingomonas TaxID=196159 RepID=UPI0006F30F15|nr:MULTISPECIES: cysteine desulfurase family protein [unclassified Sphingomonas]KQX20372.1 aminotransferase [Sphingomonas sp. Root1294]KQY67621.1 aminotransferase [Sphingomonas sp. Root50]KRB91356.1 aminotransferase [Sphingomonas sp. Root720]